MSSAVQEMWHPMLENLLIFQLLQFVNIDFHLKLLWAVKNTTKFYFLALLIVTKLPDMTLNRMNIIVQCNLQTRYVGRLTNVPLE